MGFCNGTTSVDVTQCAPCNFTTCRPLHVLVNQCTGRSSTDTASCVPCTDASEEGCSANQYMGRMCSASSLYDGVCQNCDVSCVGAAANSRLSPTGQYRLIPCSGLTNSNLVCANCLQNCPPGEYITNLCDGTSIKDTATCSKCTCPAGSYAPNNTCTGNTTANTLRCVQCTNASSCPAGHYLSGECSTFSNTACTKCRSTCGVAETEVRRCENGENRYCLSNEACFQDCPRGFYESRPCSPPNVVQKCTACSACPQGSYIQTQCSQKNDTECARCTSSICVGDEHNAQFGAAGGCPGTELQDSARCGVITESYGQRCSPNSYRVRSRIPMPHAWGSSAIFQAAGPEAAAAAAGDARFNRTLLAQPLMQSAAANASSSSSSSYLAFDAHPSRKVYAYCSGNTILTYDYQAQKLGVFLDYAHVPEPCSDIRFTASGKYLMVTSRVSTKLFRCDPKCATDEPFVWDASTNLFVCKSPRAATVEWGSGVNISCTLWVGPSSQSSADASFSGGVHNFGAAPDSVIYVAGTFQSTSTVSSWLWYAWADAQQARYLLYTFAAGVQVVGPPAYNHRTRRLFVPANNRNQPDKCLIIYELALSNPVVPITASTISVFYEQSYASVSALLSNVPPHIPGFSARTDTGAISMVDEQLRRILVFSSCPVASPGAYCASGPDFSTDYGTAAYKVILEACMLFLFLASASDHALRRTWNS